MHPYIVLTVCEMDEDYMKFLLPYLDKAKDPIIDFLMTKFEGVTILTLSLRRLGKDYVR